MKKNIALVILFIICTYKAFAGDLLGMICNESNRPLEMVNVMIRSPKDNRVIAVAETSANGKFTIRTLNSGTYILKCTRLGYQDYNAEIEMKENENLDLGRLIMPQTSIQIDEVAVVTNRNVFTADKQSIYPSKLQVEQSTGGLELLKKLPIPLLDINPISRTISTLDPQGGVIVLINEMPSEANDIAMLDPKRIKKVEVIRNPGMKYGSNLAMAVNIVLYNAEDGVSVGVNTSNSTKIIYGYNNLFGTYIHKNSQLTINQSENFQNSSNQISDDQRKYLLPTGDWQTIHIQTQSSRAVSFTHGTTVKYNLTIPDKYVFQAIGYINSHRNPKNNRSDLISGDGLSGHMSETNIRDQYLSPALNLYLKKFLPKNQTCMFNIVGTYISSNYDHSYLTDESNFKSNYMVEGKKISVIGELRYSKNFQWGAIASGLRSFYGNTTNLYSGRTQSKLQMRNLNSDIYVEVEGRWKQFSGRTTLALNAQYYAQSNEKYHKVTMSPQISLNYSPASNFSLGYGFNLVSRLPSLANLNGAAIQLDVWERRIGNPLLQPFNHIENSLSATYYTPKIYGMISAVYASNKHGIMPRLIRSENLERISFDNIIRNERDMNQIVLTAYLRYAMLNNKLVFSATGSYNYFNARSDLYTNKRGFFFGDLSIEGYIGRFSFLAGLRSRYNSLFAETVWFNEYTNSLSATYKYKNFSVGLTWEQPLQSSGTNNRIKTQNDYAYKLVKNINREAGNHVLVTFSWRWDHGFKSKSQDADVDNRDTDSGILK